MSDRSPPLVLGRSSGCKRGTPGSSPCGPSQTLVEDPAAVAAKTSQPPASATSSDSPTAAGAVLLTPVANKVMRSEAPTHVKRRRQLDFPVNIAYTSDKDKGLEDEELVKMTQYSFRAIGTFVQRQNTELRESCYYWQAHMPLVRDAFGKIIHSEAVGFGDSWTGGGMLPRILLPKDLENLSKQDDGDLVMESMSKRIRELKAQVKVFKNDSAAREKKLAEAQIPSKNYQAAWRWYRKRAKETRRQLRKADKLLTEHHSSLAEQCREKIKYWRKLHAKREAYKSLLQCFRRSQSRLEQTNAQIGILRAALLEHEDRWAELTRNADVIRQKVRHLHPDEITSIDVDPNSLPTRSNFPDSTSPMRIE